MYKIMVTRTQGLKFMDCMGGSLGTKTFYPFFTLSNLGSWILAIYIEYYLKSLLSHNEFSIKFFLVLIFKIGTSVRSSSWSAFRRSTGNDVSGHKKQHYFLFFSFSFFSFPVVYFSHRRSARIKKLILKKLTGASKNLGVDTFPDPVSQFWTT